MTNDTRPAEYAIAHGLRGFRGRAGAQPVPRLAVEIRRALKATFPGQTFDVRSQRYALGTSVDVRWQDGPARDAVGALLARYCEVQP